MIYEINFNNPYKQTVPKKRNPSIPQKVEAGLKAISNEANDTSTLNLVIKTAKDVCKIIQEAGNKSKDLAETVSKFTFFSQTLTFLGVAKKSYNLYTDTIIDLPKERKLRAKELQKKRLNIANHAIGITQGMWSAPFLLEGLGAYKFTKITNTLEKIPGVGVAAKLYPLSTIMALIALVQLSLSIAKSIDDLRSFEEDSKKANKKAQFWAKLSSESLLDRYEQKKNELKTLGEEIEIVKQSFTQQNNSFEKLEESYKDAQQRNFKDLPLRERWKAKRNLRGLRKQAVKEATKCQYLFDFYKELVNHQSESQQKCEEIELLQKNFKQIESSEVEQLKQDKLTKWQKKHKIAKLHKIKEGCQIAIKTIVIITIIASLVLTGVGVSALPIALTTLSLTLLAHVASLGVKWGFNYGMPRYEPVSFSKRFEKHYLDWRSTSPLSHSQFDRDPIMLDESHL